MQTMLSKTIMNKRRFSGAMFTLVGILIPLAGFGADSSPTKTGGIALSKTAPLAQQVIPIENANPEVVLALAARHGKAKGKFAGKAAQAVKKRFGKDIPIYIDAEKIGKVPNQPGCDKIRMTFYSTPEFAAQAGRQSVDMAVCPKGAK